MSASPEHGGKCRAARGDRGKSAYTGQNHSFVSTHACPFRRLRRHLPRSRGRLFCESFPYFSILLILFSIFCVCPHLPLPSTCRLTPSPCSGTAYGSCSFLYFPSCGDDFCVRHFIIFRFCSYKTAVSFPVYYFPCL